MATIGRKPLKPLLSAAVILTLFALTGCARQAKMPGGNQSLTPAMGQDINEEEQLANLPLAELLSQGEQFLREDNLKLAQIYFARALIVDSESPSAMAGMGEILRRQGNPEKALMLFSEALGSHPIYPAALLGAGRSSRDLGRYGQASRHFAKLLENDPNNSDALTDLAFTYDLSEKTALAEPLYRQILELNPNDATAMNNLGFNYLLQGKYALAIRHLEKTRTFVPENQSAVNNLAAAYALSGQEQKALRLFEDTVGKAGAYNNLGFFYMSHRQWEKAEKAFKKALELNPVFYVKAKRNLEYLQEIKEKDIVEKAPHAEAILN